MNTVSYQVEAIREWVNQHRGHEIGDCSECDSHQFREEIARRERDAREAANPKVRENRLRRAAERQKLKMEKARVRDPRAVDWGTYRLVDPYHNTLVCGSGPGDYGLTLDDVERELDVRTR